MRRFLKFVLLPAIIIVVTLCFTAPIFAAPGGFDEFGYNYKARIFVGPADGVDRSLDGMY